MDLKVAHYWEHRYGCKWDMLSQKITSTSLVKLSSIALRPEHAVLDRGGWMEGKGGNFTVKLAYKLSKGWVKENSWEGWKMVWRIKV